MPDNARQSHRSTAIVGVLLIILGVAANEWIVEATLSPDGALNPKTLRGVWLAQGLSFATGLMLFLSRKRLDLYGIGKNSVRSHPNLVALGFGLTVSAALFLLVEGVFNAANANRHNPEVYHYSNGDLHEYDAELGYKPIPNHESTVTLTWDGELVSSVTYTFDEFGRRITPGGEPDETRNESILVFGCSFVQGSGVENDETLPSQIARLTPSYAVYNYGYGGYGAQQMLAQLQRETLDTELGAPPAIALYVFIPGHIRRTYGSMNVINRWAEYFPYCSVDASGATLAGTFHTAQPFRVALFHLLEHEQVIKYYGMDIPATISEGQIEYTASVIQAARDAFVSRFKSDRFYVVIWPSHPRDEIPGTRIISHLESAAVRTLAYTQITGASDPDFLIKYDLHPSAKAHAIMARHIVADLHLAEPTGGHNGGE